MKNPNRAALFPFLLAAFTFLPAREGRGQPRQAEKARGFHEIPLEYKILIPPSFPTPLCRYVDLNSGKASWDFGRAGGEVRFLAKKDKVFLDRDGNGKVDPGTDRLLEGGEILEGSVTFHGKKVPYPVKFENFGTSGSFRLRLLACVTGRWRRWRFYFFDRNMDGRFFQFGADQVSVLDEKRDKGWRKYSFPARPFPLSRVLLLGGKLFKLVLQEGKGSLRLTPYPGKTAGIRVKGFRGREGFLDLVLADPERDFFFKINQTGVYRLPEGNYLVKRLDVPFPQGGKAGWGNSGRAGFARPGIPAWDFFLQGYTLGRQAPVHAGGKEAVLNVGPPYQLDFHAQVRGKRRDRLEIRDVFLVSPSGLRFPADLQERGATRSILFYLRGDGKKTLLGDLHYSRLRGVSRRIPLSWAWRPGAELLLVFRSPALGDLQASKKLAELRK